MGIWTHESHKKSFCFCFCEREVVVGRGGKETSFGIDWQVNSCGVFTWTFGSTFFLVHSLVSRFKTAISSAAASETCEWKRQNFYEQNDDKNLFRRRQKRKPLCQQSSYLQLNWFDHKQYIDKNKFPLFPRVSPPSRDSNGSSCWIIIYGEEFSNTFGANLKSSWDLKHNRFLFTFSLTFIVAFIAYTLPLSPITRIRGLLDWLPYSCLLFSYLYDRWGSSVLWLGWTDCHTFVS